MASMPSRLLLCHRERLNLSKQIPLKPEVRYPLLSAPSVTHHTIAKDIHHRHPPRHPSKSYRSTFSQQHISPPRLYPVSPHPSQTWPSISPPSPPPWPAASLPALSTPSP